MWQRLSDGKAARSDVMVTHFTIVLGPLEHLDPNVEKSLTLTGASNLDAVTDWKDRVDWLATFGGAAAPG